MCQINENAFFEDVDRDTSPKKGGGIYYKHFL